MPVIRGAVARLALPLRVLGSRPARSGSAPGHGDGDTAGKAGACGRPQRQAGPRPAGGRWLIFTPRICSVSSGKACPGPAPPGATGPGRRLPGRLLRCQVWRAGGHLTCALLTGLPGQEAPGPASSGGAAGAEGEIGGPCGPRAQPAGNRGGGQVEEELWGFEGV